MVAANKVLIKELEPGDFEMLCIIYKQGIDTGIATFQTAVPTWDYWDKSHLPFGRIGVFENKKMLGWASLSAVSSRPVYMGVAELSIYVDHNHRNQGIGKYLLLELIKESEKNDIWTLQSSIFAENNASINLHLKCGFRIIGTREKIALHHGVWKDNVILEKRSKIIGKQV